MPEQYVAIKRTLRKDHPNMPEAEVKKRAAKIFNAQRKEGQKPVTGKHKTKRSKR